MCLANGAIMVLEIPSFGIAASVQSLITCLVTFGEAEGYARNLEIHDITFVFGQLAALLCGVCSERKHPGKEKNAGG